jgi:hypothetical protein
LIEKPIDSGQLIACIEDVFGCRVGGSEKCQPSEEKCRGPMPVQT